MYNMHRVMIEAHFQKWGGTYAAVIPDDVHVKLVALLTDDVPRVDPNDPNAKIITFRHFHFYLGFTFLLSKFFKKLLFGFDGAEFFYFFEVRRYEKYAQVRVCNAKLFDILSKGDRVWHVDVLEVSGRCEGENDINKKLDFEPDLAKKLRLPSDVIKSYSKSLVC
ncbi:hypothetical protein L3X38_032217 [Prunus dulcis]|uniref:Uncharacterized protein n=1 Tax=Prunus dulcis TaxID=3755 RepID=A0AAD4VDN4_PRUDU|nr:hypothetical protein L3X38_032217 [Prunus dulcis]